MEQYRTKLILERALLGLYPKSFYHPAWQFFSEDHYNPSAQLIQNLIQTSQQVQRSGDTHDACEILLICAVLQSRNNELPAALATAHQALVLAQKHDLKQVSNWSAWGVCALCVKSGDYHSAIKILNWLQTRLQQEGQWVQVNHLEIINMTLSSGSKSSRYFDQILDIFSRWGEPNPAKNERFEISSLNEQESDQPHIIDSSSTSSWEKLKKVFWKPWLTKWLNRWNQPTEKHSQVKRQPTSIQANHTFWVEQSKPNLNAIKNGQPSTRKLKTFLSGPNYVKTTLSVHLLGEFRIAINDKPIIPFPHGQCRVIFEYIVFHHHQNIPKEMLMGIFWPEVDPASARNCLNVAIYNIRQALRTVIDQPIIVFNDGAYGLNPEIDVWVDVEEFDWHIKVAHKHETQGKINKAKTKLEIAANLYQGDFLAEDLCEEWAIYHRERLRSQYIDTVSHLCRIYYQQGQYTACATLCQLILKYDHCYEDAHCCLMRCYGRQNQYHLAIRQFHICAEALKTELGIEPDFQTVKLYERALRREHTQPL
jgi:DNA-binding SARP family transcriptional activator